SRPPRKTHSAPFRVGDGLDFTSRAARCLPRCGELDRTEKKRASSIVVARGLHQEVEAARLRQRAGDRERGPAGEKCQAPNRRDCAEEGDAAERERVQTAGEEDDAADEAPAGGGDE